MLPVVAPTDILVPSPKTLAVVTLLLSKLNVDPLEVMSPPSMFRSPSKSTPAFLIVVIPLVLPITIFDAEVNRFALTTLFSNKLNSAWFEVMSPPSMFRSPSKSTPEFLIVVIPVVSPITIFDADLNKDPVTAPLSIISNCSEFVYILDGVSGSADPTVRS